jgi:hypothetical protein
LIACQVDVIRFFRDVLQPRFAVILRAQFCFVALLDAEDFFPPFNFFIASGRGDMEVDVVRMQIRCVRYRIRMLFVAILPTRLRWGDSTIAQDTTY